MTPGGGINRHMLINRTKPPFGNAELRRSMALSIDRQAFIDIVTEGQGELAVCCDRLRAADGGCRQRC